ncbi:centromere-associated protein E-like [Homarus americanus]|uniref:Centromere-associated protein E-like n=1 Tax=Homarus americanus TaxID=6706 RepID=A0A8J5THR1_HOMAM|nr:centromere-associated protein E-like [Homarus americanus]
MFFVCMLQLLALMKKGDKNRHVGITNMNERSSRSHTIFRLILESRERSEGEGSDGAVTVSHLNLVDLAGSENASQSGATGERLKEGGFINKSLFMLGRVISQLSDGEQFVNFRDSKLTRILQLSLGGNAKTAIFCTVTPATVEQTHSTLRFASSAKSIKNKPVVNEVLSEAALLQRYAKEIKNLKKSLEKERNTDRAQEVEQVREKLDEEARKNQELLMKVNELKAKIVVSSHPRNCSPYNTKKKKKMRRETWAAPALARAMRESMGPAYMQPIPLTHQFLLPSLPPWSDLPKISEGSSSDTTDSTMDCSVISDGFGRNESSFSMDLELAEQSKLGKLDLSPYSPPPLKHRKMVQFELTPELSPDDECQAEESYLTSKPSTPRRETESPVPSHHLVIPGTPGTPAHILRERNRKMQEKLKEQEDWLKECQEEFTDLQEYQKHEIILMEESFASKIADGSVDNTTLQEQRKEIMFLKHSLRDSEALLLDANRALSQRSQEIQLLQKQREKLTQENLRCFRFEDELTKLCEEHKQMKKIMDAWKEIAAYEGSNTEEVKRRSQRVSLLEEEISKLRSTTQLVQGEEQVEGDLQKQLKEALLKQEATQQEMEEQNMKFKQMAALVERMTGIESQVSKMEAVETELASVQDEVKTLRAENSHLRSTANDLQKQLDEKAFDGESNQIQVLQEEVQSLREKLEESVDGSVFTGRNSHYVSKTRENTLTSWEISCKLSETLQALEETVITSSTPGRNSFVSLDENFLQPQDLETIKQQLLWLQEALVAQDQCQLQLQQELENLKAKAMSEQLYPQMVSQVEEELNLWRVQESFCGEYFVYSKTLQNSVHSHSDQIHQVQTGNVYKAGSSTSMEQTVQNADEIQTGIKPECEIKEEHRPLKDILCQDTAVKRDTSFTSQQSAEPMSPAKELHQASKNETLQRANESLCVTPLQINTPLSLADELRWAEMNSTLSNETFETCLLNLVPDSSKQEVQQLKEQLEILSHENQALQDKVRQLQASLQQTKENMVIAGQEENLRDQSKNTMEKSQNLVNQLEKELESLKTEKSALELKIKTLKEENDTSILGEEMHCLRWQVNTLKEEKVDLEEELKLTQEDLEQMTKEKQLQFTANKLSSEADLPSTSVLITCSKCSVNIDENDLQNATKVVEQDKKVKISLEDDFSLKEEVSKIQQYDEAETRRAEPFYEKEEIKQLQEETQELSELILSLREEKDKYILTLQEMKESLQSKTEEWEEAREIALSLKSKMKLLDYMTKEMENAKVIVSSIKGVLGKDLGGVGSQGETIDIADTEVKGMKEVVLALKNLKNVIEDKTAELENANSIIASYKAKKNLKEMSESDELREMQKKLENKTEELEILKGQKEKLLLDFEDQLANVVAEKDNELELIITNFTEKEETFENKEKELQEMVSQIKEIRKTLVNKDLEVQNLNKENIDFKNIVKDLELNLSKKVDELSVMEGKYSILQKEFEHQEIDYDNKIQEMKKSVSGNKEQIITQAQNVKHLQRSLEEQKNLLSSSEEEKELLKNNYEKQLSDSAHVSRITSSTTWYKDSECRIIDQKLDELEQLKDEYAIKVKECHQFRDSVDNLKIMLAKKEEELKVMSSDHNEELSTLSENINEKIEEINNFENIVKRKNDEAVNLKLAIEAKDHKIKKLESDMKEVKEILDGKEKDLEESLSNRDGQMSTKLQGLQGEIDHLTRLHEEVCADRRNMVDVIKNHEEELGKLTSDCNALKCKLESLEEDYQHVSENLKTKDAEISQKEDSISMLESEYQKLQEDIDHLRSKEKELLDQHDSSNQEIEKLLGVVEKYEIEMSEKDEQLNKMTTEVESKMAKIFEVEESIKLLQEANKEMVLKCDSMEDVKKKYISLEEELYMLRKDSNELKSLPDSVTALEAIEGDIHAKIREHEELDRKESQEQELNIKLLKSEEECKTVKNELSKIEMQLQEKIEFVNKITVEHNTVKLALENVEADLRNAKLSLESTEAELREKISSLESENMKLEEELSASKTNEKEINAQVDASTQQIEKLVMLVEKYETEMSEKDEVIQSQTTKYESEVLVKGGQVQGLITQLESKTSMLSELEETLEYLLRTNEEMTKKCEDLEELRKKCMSLEEKLMNVKNDFNERESITDKLAAAENKIVALQDDVNSRSNKYSEEIARLVSEREELNTKFIQTEKELKSSKETLEKFEQRWQKTSVALAEKQEKCNQLNDEMDDLVDYYKKERVLKAEAYDELSQRYVNIETELSTTKLKLGDLFQSGLASNSHFDIDNTLQKESELQSTLESLQKELLAKQEELSSKEQECTELNAEMDDMMKYYKQQGQIYAEQCDSYREKLKKAQNELMENKKKKLDLSQGAEAHMGDSSIKTCSNQPLKIFENDDGSLIKEKDNWKEVVVLRTKNTELEQRLNEYRERNDDLNQSRATLQEELKISSDTVNSLLERLGDQEKYRMAYQKEEEALGKKIMEYKCRIEAFKQSAGNQKASLEKIDELIQNVKYLECELETSKKNFEDLAEENNTWKIEYTRLFEVSEELKAQIAQGKILLEEQKKEHKEKLMEMTTGVNTTLNCPSSDTSGLNLTGKGRKSRIATLELEKGNLKDVCVELTEKVESLESTLESLRQSQGIVSSVEEFQHELTWMREKMKAAEKERDLTSTKYDSWERDFEALQMEVESLRDQENTQDAAAKTGQLKELERKYGELQEENAHLRQRATKTKTISTSVGGDEALNMEERLAATERENNELRFRLRALNAPAEKEVQRLKEELILANQKITHMKKELRRIQNIKCMDSTICEMKASLNKKGCDGAQSNVDSKFNYASGSGVILEIQVLELQNQLYHLEKEKKMIENECKTLEQHLDHYKGKAQEWKVNALKENKLGEKIRKELKLLLTENTQYKTKVEEMRSRIERQQFELGHQREIVEKLEKEKQKHTQKLQTNSSKTVVGSRTQHTHPSPKKETEVISKGASNYEDIKPKSSSNACHLGALNAPLPTQTYIENLPGVKPPVETQRNPRGKVPTWQGFNKENKDYSRYFTASGSHKKKEEECKTQ